MTFLWYWRLGLLVLLLGAVAAAGPGRAAAQEPATATVVPATAPLSASAVQEFSVVVNGAVEAVAIDIELSFDPLVAEVVDSDPATPAVDVAIGPLLSPDFVVMNVADNVNGLVRLVFTQVAPRAPVSGDGTVLTVTLRGLSGGDPMLAIHGVVLANASGSAQPVIVGGEVAPPPGTPTPTPTAQPPVSTPVPSPTPSTGASAAATSASPSVLPSASPPDAISGDSGDGNSDGTGAWP